MGVSAGLIRFFLAAFPAFPAPTFLWRDIIDIMARCADSRVMFPAELQQGRRLVFFVLVLPAPSRCMGGRR